MDEELEVSAAGLLSEMKAVKAWVELEKARIAGDGGTLLLPVDGDDGDVAKFDLG